jgi:hypothetical protein
MADIPALRLILQQQFIYCSYTNYLNLGYVAQEAGSYKWNNLCAIDLRLNVYHLSLGLW